MGEILSGGSLHPARPARGDLGAQRGFGGAAGAHPQPPAPRLCSPAFCEAASSSRQAGKLGYLLFYFLIFPSEATGVEGGGWFPIFILHLSPHPTNLPSARRIGSCLKTEKGKKEKKLKLFRL